MEKPKRRTLTRPGLGAPGHSSGLLPKQTPATVPPSSGVRTRTSRPPLRVDDVGDAAVALGAKHGREKRASAPAPKLLKSRRELEAAPIDHRDAFVLSLIDGRTSVQGIVDMAGMADLEVHGILERLATLGILQLP